MSGENIGLHVVTNQAGDAPIANYSAVYDEKTSKNLRFIEMTVS